MDDRTTVAALAAPPAPPEGIEDAPITLDVASELMSQLGFVDFRTPPGDTMPQSCLMAILRATPTLVHFDPERVTYWAVEQGRGQLAVIDSPSVAPISRPYSWGPIRLFDRLGIRNSFVSFGGWLTGEPVGADALLLVFRSEAPIFRLPGHSQHSDLLAEDALAFFGRVVPHLWSPADERFVASVPPEELYAAYLIHERSHDSGREEIQGSGGGPTRAARREIELLANHRPQVLAGGEALLARLGLAEVRRPL